MSRLAAPTPANHAVAPLVLGLPTTGALRASDETPLPFMTPGQWRVLVNRHVLESRHQRVSLALMAVSLDGVQLHRGGNAGQLADAPMAEVVLNLIARRLRGRVRQTDRVVRIGADCIGVVLAGGDATLLNSIRQRIAPALAGTCRIGKSQLAQAQVSTRSAVYPDQGCTGEALLHALGTMAEPARC